MRRQDRASMLIVEKPIDSRPEATDALIRACRLQTKLTCIFQHRFDPGVRCVWKEAAENGEPGRSSFGAAT